MKAKNLLSALFILALSTAAAQTQDKLKNTNPFLLSTSQTNEHLNSDFAKQIKSPIYAHLTDPGPVWQGLTDTTAFNERMSRHIYKADTQINWIKKQLEGYTKDHAVGFTLYEPDTAKALRYLEAVQELENAQLLAPAALNAHPEESFRDVAQQWESRISEKLGRLNTDFKVYFYLTKTDLSDASPELRYIVDQRLTEFERNGIMLDKEKRERIAGLQAKVTKFGTQFERNIFTADTSLTFHIDSLSGIPSDWIERHAPDEIGFVTFAVNNPNMQVIMTQASNSHIRKAAMRAFSTKSYPQNISVLDSLRSARHQLATLLGYESWAQYVMEPMMTGSPERVQSFLAAVDSAAQQSVQHEISRLLEVKKEMNPTAQKVDWIDWWYLQNKLNNKEYAFDSRKIREYLPYGGVRDGLFAVTERLFEVRIKSVPEISVWDPSVEAYELRENGKLIGRFYLDMFPREGKFGHAGEFHMRIGNNTVPETTLLVNLPDGEAGEPALLNIGEVKTFFHEFGHLLHSLFMGNNAVVGNVEQDFVEAPSQLFERWVDDPAFLSRFAEHYKTGEPIPSQLVTTYLTSNNFGRALQTHHLLWPAFLSLQLYNRSPQEISIGTIEEKVLNSRFAFDRREWIRPTTFLPHLFPYSSNYYTYLWSDVIARDLFTEFDQENLLDPEIGQRFRKTILEPSGTAPMDTLIHRFLGRPFNTDAWEAWLNGDSQISANK